MLPVVSHLGVSMHDQAEPKWPDHQKISTLSWMPEFHSRYNSIYWWIQEMYGTNSRVYVMKTILQCFKPIVKHGAGNIQVWPYFAYSGVGYLHRIDSTLTNYRSHSILQRDDPPSGFSFVEKDSYCGWIMSPNTPKRPKKTKESRLSWTARSCCNNTSQQVVWSLCQLVKDSDSPGHFWKICFH